MLSYYLSLLETKEDKSIFTDLYMETHVHIEKLVCSMLKNRHDAEDALQNTYVQAAKNFATVLAIPREERPYWLRTVAKNEARMIIRENKKTVAVDDWSAFEAEADAMDVTNYNELVQLFTQLPETYRETLELRFLMNCSGQEIAARLGVSESVVNTRIHRGRALLKKIIEKEGYR